MAFRSAGRSRPTGSRPITLPRWAKYVLPVLAVVVALIVLLTIAAGVWTDLLWFRSVHYSSVFATTYGVKWALFAITAVFMMAVIGINIRIAYRLRPANRPVSASSTGWTHTGR